MKIYASQIVGLTSEDIGDDEVILLHDPLNLTNEHAVMIRTLALERDRTNELQVSCIDAQCKDSLSPDSSYGTRATTPIVTSEEQDHSYWVAASEAYKSLIADGGRPSHPIELGRDAFHHPENYKRYEGIIKFWAKLGGSFAYDAYNHQRDDWRRFRKYQDRVRGMTRQTHSSGFKRYARHVAECQPKGISQPNLKIQWDRSQQHRLADWCEYRAYKIRGDWDLGMKTERMEHDSGEQNSGTIENEYLKWIDNQYLQVATECGFDLRCGSRKSTPSMRQKKARVWSTSEPSRRSLRLMNLSKMSTRSSSRHAANSAGITKSKSTRVPKKQRFKSI